MAKLEHGSGKLISVDTNKKTLKIKEIRSTYIAGRPAKEWELPYKLSWEAQQFYEYISKRIEYVLSDGAIVSLKSGL